MGGFVGLMHLSCLFKILSYRNPTFWKCSFDFWSVYFDKLLDCWNSFNCFSFQLPIQILVCVKSNFRCPRKH